MESIILKRSDFTNDVDGRSRFDALLKCLDVPHSETTVGVEFAPVRSMGVWTVTPVSSSSDAQINDLEAFKNIRFSDVELKQITLSLVETLKKRGYRVDCFSSKSKGKPGGKATIDCDVAIDVFSYDGKFVHSNLVATSLDPYGKGQDMTRLKFNFNEEEAS